MNFRLTKAYSTHNILLIKTVLKSQGPVLEFGAGPFSTPLLHWLCKDLGKKLITLENDTETYNFAKQFQSRFHHIRFISNWDDFPVSGHYGVVFIDHGHPSRRRGIDALRFKDSAQYLVLHDTESEKNYRYDSIWNDFKYRYDWKECRPWTTVVSNVDDLTTLYLL